MQAFKSVFAVVMLFFSFTAFSQNAEKPAKLQTFEVEQQIAVPIDLVWQHIAVEFGEVAKSHHGFVKSMYIGNSSQGGEGAQRTNYLNEDGSRYVEEQQIQFSPEEFAFAAKVTGGKGLPLASGTNIAYYRLEAIDANTTVMHIRVEMRSDPPIFSTLFKGQYKKWMEGYAQGVNHYLITGEEVNKETLKSIKTIH